MRSMLAVACVAFAARAAGATDGHVVADYGRLPLHFEPNQGQTDGRVRFLARGRGYGLFLTSSEAVLSLRSGATGSAGSNVVRMKLLGANPNPEVRGTDDLPGKSHYFLGSDPGRWHTNVPQYARVEYRAVWPGVDLIYYGNQGQLEYDFVVAPGADPRRIRLRVEGAKRVRLDGEGDLVLTMADGGEVVQKAPVIYQDLDGARKPVTGRYVLRGKRNFGFEVEAWDRTKALVIDPVLVYSTYLGNSNYESGHGIAVDASGNAYVTGFTSSPNWPATHDSDVFVTKLNAAGSALVYSTYFGGSAFDFSFGIAVDVSGNAYVTGETGSLDFPTANALQGTHSGSSYDAFVTKLDAAGSALVYSTYLGGNDIDRGRGIAVDVSANAHLTGATASSNFPTANALQGTSGGSLDVFVTKLNAAGSALVYSTYLGGSSDDFGFDISLDVSENAYVTGHTSSSNFPTANALQGTHSGGSYDAFVTKLNAVGSALVYSTYLGGSDRDIGRGIAVDGSGNAYVTGETYSSNFPVANAAQGTFGGSSDVFVTKLHAAGSALVYSSYLGGSDFDSGHGIAVDASGNAFVSGQTSSANFPTANAVQGTFGGTADAFVAKLGDVSGPLLSVSDVTVTEGNSDTTPAVFTVSLFPAGIQTVTVDYATALSTAFPGSDYFDVSGTLTFPPGTTSQTVTVSVLGDRIVEPDEVFFVGLRNANGATLSKVLGEGTILNDDLPGVSIADTTVSEGSSANAAFLVTLTPPGSQTVSVSYSTADGTANAGSDYTAVSGTLTFTPFRTMQTIIVPILTDILAEGSETFFVDLSNPVGTTIASGRGTGTINDPPTSAHVPMYRAYSRSADYHFFTTSLASKDFAVSSLGYQDESNPIPFYVWNTQQPSAVPLFRMYNPNRGRHYYTAEAASRDYLISIGMNYEGDEGFIYPTMEPGTVELFRLYNRNSGTHLYLTDAQQKDDILRLFPSWEQHTSVGFVFASP